MPLPLALTPIVLHRGKTGEIRIAPSADGPILQFDLDCDEALPYCQAKCCAIPGTFVTEAERNAGVVATRLNYLDEQWELERRADGYCVHNSPTTRRCGVYADRPHTCQVFHCTRTADARGWRLTFDRFTT